MPKNITKGKDVHLIFLFRYPFVDNETGNSLQRAWLAACNPHGITPEEYSHKTKHTTCKKCKRTDLYKKLAA